METAIIYCRVSDPRQVQQGNSLATQKRQADEYVTRHGYTLDRVFIEEGESAKTDNRTVLKQLLEYCRLNRGRIHVLVVPKIDRFARNRDEYGALKIKLKQYGVRLESVGEHIEDTAVGRFTESMLASVAQFDNEMRAERSKGGMVEAVVEGRWVWNAMRGYKNVRVEGKGTIEPHPIEFHLIARAFEMLADGDTLQSVRRWLATKGMRLSDGTFRHMVKRRAYMGVIKAFGKEVQAKPPFVGLVTPATFYAAQQSLTRLRGSNLQGAVYQRDREDFALRGTLKCFCGKYLTASFAQGNSTRVKYYRCMECRRININGAKVETAFAQMLDQLRFSDADQQKVARSIKEQLEKRKQADKPSIDANRKSAEELRKLRTALAFKSAEGVIPDDVAREQFAELDVKIASLDREIQNATREFEIDEVLDFGFRFLSECGTSWRKPGLANKKPLQDCLFPDGLACSKDLTFRTWDYPQLERIIAVNTGAKSQVVDHRSRNYEPLIDLFLRLQLRFGIVN